MYQSINDLLLQSCDTYKNNIAFSNMGKNLSYSELENLSIKFAAFLQQKLFLKKGDRVAIMLPNLLQYPVAMFGALLSGCVVVNVNPLYTVRELAHQLQDSGASTIVILDNFGCVLKQALDEYDINIRNIIFTNIGDLLKFPKSLLINNLIKLKYKNHNIKKYYKFKQILQNNDTYNYVEVSGDDLAFLQYTGGTTGVAKGAMLAHKNIIANINQISKELENIVILGREIIITALPLYHIFSLTVNCLSFTHLGGHNVLVTNPRDLNSFVKILSNTRFTIITGVNTLFNAILNHKKFATIDFSAAHFAIGGGMALQKNIISRWLQDTGTPLLEGYGLTECSPVICINPLHSKESIGVGRTVCDTKVKLQDNELLIKGPQVMQGYWDNKAETTEAIDQDGWFHTGDFATIDDNGFVHIVDRKKDLIIVSGFNVFPSEIEAVLLQCNGILEAAVIGVPDADHGELVKAYIVLQEHSKLSEQEIIDYCHEELTAYKVPKIVAFRDALPKSPVGKILKRLL